MRPDSLQKIIVATDASVSDVYKIATWSCWIVTPIGDLQYCRQLSDNHYSGNSTMCELFAVCNALALLDQQVKDLENHHVIVYADNNSFLTVPMTKAGQVKRAALEKSYIIDLAITPIASKCGLFEVRHVKGHTSALREKWTRQQHMNNWCDKTARRTLRQLVEAHKRREGIL